jgi:hypothetical protein
MRYICIWNEFFLNIVFTYYIMKMTGTEATFPSMLGPVDTSIVPA